MVCATVLVVSGCAGDAGVDLTAASTPQASVPITTTITTTTTTTTSTTTTLPAALPAAPGLVETDSVSTGGQAVYGIAWSPALPMLAIAGSRIQLWDADAGTVIESFGTAETVAWSAAGDLLVAEYGRSVRLWDASTWERAGGLDFGDEVRAVSLSPDGRFAVVGLAVGSSGALQTWNLADQTRIFDHEYRRMMLCVGWSSAGRLVAGGAWDGALFILDTESGDIGRVLGYGDDRRDVNGMKWSPDGARLATAHQDGAIRVWDTAGSPGNDPEVIGSFELPSGWAVGVAWSPDGALIAGGGEEGLIRVWDVATGEIVAESDGALRRVWDLSWSADGTLLAGAGVAAGGGGGVVIFELP